MAIPAVGGDAVVGHDLEVLLAPERGSLAVRDTLSLPAGQDTWTFRLHGGMGPQVTEGEAELARIGSRGLLEVFRLRLLGPGPVTLRYGGTIRGELETVREGMGRSRQLSRGTISERGVVLDGYSAWYPRFTDALERFAMDVRLPAGWTAVSQGTGPGISRTADGVRVTWREDKPQDEIHLLAAPFERYARPTGVGEAQVYLRTPDPELAERYLAATERYLKLYSALIGPYPYAKFALVENFWETGYGMPSFTLLGPRVMRLPFIIHTSYPHEVLHNWWGNGVYVDYASGNWSEGLTAYLADHLIRERHGQGAEYRRDSLKAYADYVSDGEDFPLRDFRGRHGSASQAVGYGKTAMMLHMLRRDLGDAIFIAGLRRFYEDNLFRVAGFDDLRQAFERESGRDLREFFAQWTERTGAPDLVLSGVAWRESGDGYRLTGRIAQVQGDDAFPLRVPLVVHLQGGGLAEETLVLSGREARFALELVAPPVRLAVDPRFDLFRRLAPGETPVTLSALFGARGGLILLPSAAGDRLAEGYRALAEAWAQGSPGWEVREDDALERLPTDRPVWLLGWENRFASALEGAEMPFGLDAASRRLDLAGESIAGGSDSIALAATLGDRPIGLVAAGEPAALPGLARKLPRYGRYSYLVFEGREPINRLKGQWPASDSRLQVWFTDHRPSLALPPHPPLTGAIPSAGPDGAYKH
jgi:hypothetical protein